MNIRKTKSRIIAFILIVLFMFSGLLLVAMSITGFENASPLVNQLSSDGMVESFTLDRYELVRIPALIIGSVLFCLGGAGIIFTNQLIKVLLWFSSWVKQFLKSLVSDSQQFIKSLFSRHFSWWEWVLLALLIAVGFYGRWVWLERPMLHDESYTFIAFAQRSFDKVISDYHLPNNHILNSVLIHVFYQLFGNFSPALVRLPAFISGVLIIPFAYLWVREQEGKPAAAASAALIAYWPLLKIQSTNGRGYMIMGLLTVLMFGLGEFVRRKKNRAAWGLLILVTAANFYTLPIALYPFAILGLWLLFAGVFKGISTEYGSFWHYFKYLVGYGAASGVLTFLLYTPIFVIGSGWNSFFHNPFVSSLNWYKFSQSLPVRLRETAGEWLQDVPAALVILLVMGVLLNIGLHWKRKRAGLPVLFCAVLGLSVIFIVQRPNPWPRIWTYLLPLLIVWGVTGLFDVLRLFQWKKITMAQAESYLSILLVVAALTLGGLHIRANMKYAQGEPGQEESVVLLLQDELTDADIVVAPIGFGPAFWYYFDYYGLEMDNIMNLQKKNDWERAFFLVDDRENESYQDLLNGTPVVPGETGDCPVSAVSEFFTYGHYAVMVCDRQ